MIVLNFWANLSLGVLIKFVLIKKGLVSMNGLLTMKTSTMKKRKRKSQLAGMRFRIIIDVYTTPVTGVLARIPGAS